MPNDGGHLLMTRFGRDMLLREQPDAAKYLRRFVGAEEFLNGIERWCLWLHGENPAEFRRMRAVMDRVHAVAIHRKKSKRQTTKELANAPAYFAEIRQPDCTYLLIPSVSSERRRYIPIGFMRPDVIASNLVLLVPGANLYHFGVLSSAMHMAWVRQVAGRLESRYRYSNRIVYNNYPWPAEPTAAQRGRVEEAAQRILDLRVELGDGRAGFLPAAKKGGQTACLADLYDRKACRCRSTRPTPRWTARWTAATARSRSPATVSGWNSSSPSTKRSPPRSFRQRGRGNVDFLLRGETGRLPRQRAGPSQQTDAGNQEGDRHRQRQAAAQGRPAGSRHPARRGAFRLRRGVRRLPPSALRLAFLFLGVPAGAGQLAAELLHLELDDGRQLGTQRRLPVEPALRLVERRVELEKDRVGGLARAASPASRSPCPSRDVFVPSTGSPKASLVMGRHWLG